MPRGDTITKQILLAVMLLVMVTSPSALIAAPQEMQSIAISDAPRDPLPLWQHLRVLKNTTGAELSPEKAAAAIAAGGNDVMTPQRPEHDLGRRPTPVWASFSLENPGDRIIGLVLAQRYPTIEHLELYRLRKGQWERIYGTHETAKVMFERDRFPTFHLSLHAGEQASYLVKMQTVAPLRWVLSVQEPAAFANEQRRHDWALAFGYTIPLSVLLLVVFLYRLNTTPGLGYFMGLTMADIVATTWIAGFAAELLPTVSGQHLRTIGHVAYAAMLFFGPRHALAFAGAFSPKWLRTAAQFLSTAGPTAVLLALWFDPWTAAAMPGPLGFIMAGLCCGMAWHAHRQGQQHALAYIAAWSAYLVTTLLYFFVRLEVWPLEVLPLLIFGQSLGLTLLMGHTVARAVVDRDGKLRVALEEAESQQRQIASLSAERERLFAAASHDLRQPLQAIAINVELLQHRLNDTASKDRDEDRSLLDRMQVALTGTNDLLESLLDLRLDTFSQAAVEHVPLALGPMLARLGSEYRSSTAARGLMLRIAPTRAWVRSDPQRLERVLRNLLVNAVRYTESGWVLLGVRRGPGANWRIQVMDTGVGIDPESAEQLFGEHVRGVEAGPGKATTPGGYGLGLYIVHRLAEAMGARVGVRPRTIDWREGSIFEIILPACNPAGHADPVFSGVTPILAVSRPLLNRQVLVIDDDRQSREALAAGLSELGAEVHAWPGTPPKSLDSVTWHAVVCDHDLGAAQTGLELLMAHRSAMRVLVSGGLTDTIRAEALSHGIIALKKPLSLVQLMHAMSNSVTPPNIDLKQHHR